MTTAGKRKFKTAYQLGMHEHPKGTTFRLLRNTGINLSKKIATTDGVKSELKTKIEKFSIKNCSESPDMRNEKKGIRYRHRYMTVLYDDFKFENRDTKVSFSIFCAY